MNKVTTGARVKDNTTGMVGTVSDWWSEPFGEFWVQVRWDPSAMTTDEVTVVEPGEEDRPHRDPFIETKR